MTVDINLAWNRVKKDLKDKHFISPLYLPDILLTDLTKWLGALKVKIENKTFQPHPMEVVEIPKGKGLIRPGSLLFIDDNISYSALVQECYSKILAQVKWSQNLVDFAYIVTKENMTSNDWYKSQLFGWNSFREKSLEKIKEGFQYVIVTDLTGFYENIDIPILVSDLRAIGVENEIVNELSKCLNRWTQVNNKGLPQSNSASDILAKLYLDNVDKGMNNAGFNHLRYVDDIRIFCKNSSEAKRALIELTRLLRKRGLNLQSSKTKILPSNEALNEIEGIQPVITMVTKQFENEALTFQFASEYFDDEDVETETDTTNDPPIEVITETFKTYFIHGTDDKFDKTLFHFLINRLIKEFDSSALDYCLANFEKHPEETSYFLKYSKSFDDFDLTIMDLPKKMQDFLISFLSSKESVYDYQNYQILIWFSENVSNIPEELLKLCRQYAFDNNKPYYLRSVSRSMLGKYGNNADIDKIEDQLTHIVSDFERAELLCCLTKMEKSKRNALLGRVAKDGQITEMAVAFVKSLS
jgi:Reverse transcriptase (RNA-dependent DNA polymerase)